MAELFSHSASTTATAAKATQDLSGEVVGPLPLLHPNSGQQWVRGPLSEGSREGLSPSWVSHDLAEPEDSWASDWGWTSGLTDLANVPLMPPPAHVHPWKAQRVTQNWPLVPWEGPELGTG